MVGREGAGGERGTRNDKYHETKKIRGDTTKQTLKASEQLQYQGCVQTTEEERYEDKKIYTD